MKATKLKAAFKEVKKRYFPRWDSQGVWKVRLVHNFPAQGKCISKAKEILISSRITSSELKLILIHEICHSSIPHHGKKWQERFDKIAQKAEKEDAGALALKIKEEISMYRDNREVISAKYIYSQIEDYLLDNPNVSYKRLIKHLSYEHNYYPHEFEKRFKKSRHVYDAARQESLKWKKKAITTLRSGIV